MIGIAIIIWNRIVLGAGGSIAQSLPHHGFSVGFSARGFGGV